MLKVKKVKKILVFFKKKVKMLKIILGDICYPKSEVLVLPTDSKGLMNRGRAKLIAKAGGPNLLAEVKEKVSEKEYQVGEYFVTSSSRLKRRGVKEIYHCVIKRLPSDFTSLTIISKILKKVLTDLSKYGINTITICGMGIEEGDLDSTSVARITYEICKKFESDMDIKIIDNDEEFIKGVVYFSGEKT